MATFAHNLKYERELRGWSQSKLANELGTTPNTISLWERGLSSPSPYFREKICLLLAKNMQELGLIAEELSSKSEEKSGQTNDSTAATLLQEPEETTPTLNLSTHRSFRFTALPAWVHPGIGVVVVLVLLASFGLWQWFQATQTGNPYPPHVGTLTLNDLLQDQSSQTNWQEGLNANKASCEFKNGAYYARQPLSGYFHACLAQHTDYYNFTYEVAATLRNGDYTGLVFRAKDSIDSKYYTLRVYANGTYMLIQYLDALDEHALILEQGSSPAIKTGLRQTNLIAVTAQGDVITIFINKKSIGTIHDASYDHGEIGVLVGSDQTAPAEASFQDAKVWD